MISRVVSTLRLYRYEIVAFLTGAFVMILELVGARVIAPHFGTSLYVWTAVIGVILGALALGIWYGGKRADEGATDKEIAKILFAAAVVLLASVMLQSSILTIIAEADIDIRLQALWAALILFAPASALMGFITPYLAKRRLTSLDTVGRSIGRLDASSTLGSIAGTFLAGYWLISWFGNRTLGFSLVLGLILLSFVASRQGWTKRRIALGVIAILLAVVPGTPNSPVIADIDSAYSRYLVTQTDGVNYLQTDNFGIQSAQIVGNPSSLPLAYTQRFMEITQEMDPDTLLVVGGGAYTFPTAYATECGDCRIDVVEIDPVLDRIASEYFSYRPTPRINVIHEDGRVYLNKTKSAYDLIFMDAYTSLAPPYQLSTLEAAHRVREHLTTDGVVVANLVGLYEGDAGYLHAALSTYDAVFSYTALFQGVGGQTTVKSQNYIVIMAQNKESFEQAVSSVSTPRLDMLEDGKILTDDHAPVERLIRL